MIGVGGGGVGRGVVRGGGVQGAITDDKSPVISVPTPVDTD